MNYKQIKLVIIVIYITFYLSLSQWFIMLW